MKVAEVRELLAVIAGFDRRSFPDGAEVTWHELLAGIEYQDAYRAVMRYYANPDADGPIKPGELRTGAHWFAARRARAARALPPAPRVTERSAQARELIRKATTKAVERYRAEHPEARPYRHRAELATIVANAQPATS